MKKLFYAFMIAGSCKVAEIPNAEKVWVQKWKGGRIEQITLIKTDSGYRRPGGKAIPAQWKRYCKNDSSNF